MKLLNFILCMALTFNPLFPLNAAVAEYPPKNPIAENKFLRALKQFKFSRKQSPTLGELVQKTERRFRPEARESFKSFINQRNEKSLVHYSFFANKISIESQGKFLTLEVSNNRAIKINGIALNDQDFQNPQDLLAKIHHSLDSKNKAKSVSLLYLFFNSLIPQVHADFGWIGFGAIVIAAGLIAFGIHKATKNLSHTSHEVAIKTPSEITINHKVDANIDTNINGKVEGTGTLNGNLNAQGLPDKFDLNIDVPGTGNL